MARPSRGLPRIPAARVRGVDLTTLLPFVWLTAPLFALIGLGYALARSGRWPTAVNDALSRFVFTIAIPALLFRLMGGFASLPPVDPRVLVSYFGGCLVVFGLGRAVSRAAFRHDGAAQSVFALGGVFSNTVLLGIPLVQSTLGDPAMPAVSLIVVFNAVTLWMLVSVSVEWARHRTLTAGRFAATTKSVLVNPIVASILAGAAYSAVGLPLPPIVERPLALLAQAAVPLSLVALGLGLGEHPIGPSWRTSAAIAAIKLVAQPAVVYALARLAGLDATMTAVVVVMAALPVGANVYLMARHFQVLEGAVAASLVLSTALAALTTPVVLALVNGAAAPPAVVISGP